MVSSLQKSVQQKQQTCESSNLRKSVYNANLPIKEAKDSGFKANEMQSFHRSNLLIPRKNAPENEENPQKLEKKTNSFVRQSIIEKNIKPVIKNSMSCIDFDNMKLIPSQQVDSDLSNLKGLKKKLAVIEEKERKLQSEKKLLSRKNKLKKHIKIKQEQKEKTQISLSKTANAISEPKEEKQSSLKSSEDKAEVSEIGEKVPHSGPPRPAEDKSESENKKQEFFVMSKWCNNITGKMASRSACL